MKSHICWMFAALLLPLILIAQDNEYINGVSAQLVLGDGSVLDGEVQFEDMNYASKYKLYFYETLTFKEEGYDEFDRFSDSEVDHVIVTHQDNSTKVHVPFIDGYYPVEPLADKLLEKSDGDPRQNLNPGYIKYFNGDRVEAQLGVIGRKGIGFYSMEDGTNFKMIKAPIDIKYVAQIIDGKEIRYLRVKERYEEWFRWDEAISYVENPYPTHRRDGAEKFLNIAANIAGEAADAAIADKTSELERRNPDMNVEMSSGFNESSHELFGNLPGKGGIFFTEYILMSDDDIPEVVYKENWEEYLTRKLEKCPSQPDKKMLKTLSSFSNIDLAIEYFNKNGCQ